MVGKAARAEYIVYRGTETLKFKCSDLVNNLMARGREKYNYAHYFSWQISMDARERAPSVNTHDDVEEE